MKPTDPWAVTYIDSTRFFVVLAFAIALPWLGWNIRVAVYDVCGIWRRWHRKRHALDGYLIAPGQSLTSTAPRPTRSR